MAAEENLDALCSLLDDSFDDIVDGLVDDELSKIENENNIPSQPPVSQDNNEVSEMEEKLRKMQEEMLRYNLLPSASTIFSKNFRENNFLLKNFTLN